MTEKSCVVCGSPARNGTDFCAPCFKSLEERYAHGTEEPAAPPPKSRRSWAMVLAAAAVLAVAVRIPSISRSFSPPRPIRNGAPGGDATADACLRHLWTASRLMQEKAWPAGGLTCPRSGKPYVTAGKDADMSVACPVPESHGLKRLSVSRRAPIPEVKS